MYPHLFFFFLPGASGAAPIAVPDVIGGGWAIGTILEGRRRTKKELLDERIALGILPPQEAAKVESLPTPVKAKVKRAGTITLRALVGAERAVEMSTEQLAAELDRIEARTRAYRHRQRLLREDEELLLM